MDRSRAGSTSSRRTRWSGMLALVALVMLAAGCGSESDSASGGDPTEPGETQDAQPTEDVSDAEGTGSEAQIPEEYQRLALVGASQGGSLYNFYVGVSQLLNENLGMQTTVQAGATQANALEVAEGNLQAATASPIDLVEVTGDDNAPVNSAVKSLWPASKAGWHVVVGGDTDMQSVSDLAGARVSPGLTGSIESRIFEEAMACADVDVSTMDVQNIGKSEAAAAFQDGSIDAWTGLAGAPSGAFSEVFESPRGARLIALEDDVIGCLIERFTYLAPSEIPAESYAGQTASASTIDQWFYAIVHESVPDEVTYQIAKSIHEHHADLVAAVPSAQVATAENLAQFPGFALHPGVKRFLEELGLEVADPAA